MTRLATLLPEYEAVINLFGVGELTAAQLIAEIGDIRRFRSRGALIAFAGLDPLPRQSGKYEKKSASASKRGSAPLRKTLFQIVLTYLRHSPENEPVFQFLDRKRAEGKPYFVYMTAAANKFLRIYYARIKSHMEATCPENTPEDI
jgi:transposase